MTDARDDVTAQWTTTAADVLDTHRNRFETVGFPDCTCGEKFLLVTEWRAHVAGAVVAALLHDSDVFEAPQFRGNGPYVIEVPRVS